MGDPLHMAEIGNGDRASIGERQWRMTFQGRMAARCVVVVLELGQLAAQVTGIPEQQVVEKFSPHGSDQPFHKWVGQRHIRHGLEFVNFQNPKVRRPAVGVEHRIVIGTERSGNALPLNGRVKHPADVTSGDGAAMDAGANEAARELIHDDEYPVAAEHDRLAAKEIHAPEAVCRMADERQPGGSSAARRRAIVFGQHAVHDGIPRAGLCRVFQCPPGSVGSHGVADAA